MTADHENARVLWITDEPPSRRLGGGNIRQAHLIEALARRARVTLLVIGSTIDDRTRDAVADYVHVPGGELRPPRSKTLRRVHDLWIALRGAREVVITAERRRLIRRQVRRVEDEVDIVVTSHLGMAALRPRSPRARWVAQLHHVSSAMARQQAAVTPGGRQRWLLEREAAAASRVERQIMETFDTVVVASAEDAALLDGHAAPVAPVVVVPNGVDTDEYRPTPLPSTPTIVMTGSFQYQPNADGAVWFCDEVLPLVRQSVAAATLTLVGRQPLPEVTALAQRSGVEVHADVPEMGSWLELARVTVVPLRIGTGTRLKALEAMAAGRPVVGTSIGLDGLPLEDGVHAHLADSPAAMAQAIVRVLTDDEHAVAMAAAARTLVEERFTWSAIGSRFADELLAAP